MNNSTHLENIDVIHMSRNRVYHKSSGGIVLYANDDPAIMALLQWKEKKGWTFPKGHIKTKETAKHAAQREVREELGIAYCPLPIKKLGVEHIVFKLPEDNRIHYKQTHIYVFLLDRFLEILFPLF